MRDFNSKKQYTEEELCEMVRTLSYPIDAPPYIIRLIQERRRRLNSRIKSPSEEMDEFMRRLGGSKKMEE